MPFSLPTSLASIFIRRRFVRLSRKGAFFIATPEAAIDFLDSCKPAERAAYSIRNVYLTQRTFDQQQPTRAPSFQDPFIDRQPVLEVREREAA